MNKTYILPIILMVIQAGCAVVYLADGQIKRMIYWLAATILIAAVTF